MVIYKIENKINGLIYIGQTKADLSVRIMRHKVMNKYYIQRALNKYGLESFTVSVIDEVFTKEAIDEKEKYWIKFYDCRSPKGYNCTGGGDGNDTPRSEETRRRMSMVKMGKNHPMYGKHHTAESNQKRREALTGTKNHNYGKDFSGANNPTYGTHHSIEARLKMSKPRSPEGCANIKASLTRDVIEKRARARKKNALKLKAEKAA